MNKSCICGEGLIESAGFVRSPRLSGNPGLATLWRRRDVS